MNIKKVLYTWFRWQISIKRHNMPIAWIRIFTAILLIQFGIDKIIHFNELSDAFPHILGMSSEIALIMIILVEFVGSLSLILGFCTKFVALISAFAMLMAFGFVTTSLHFHYSTAYLQGVTLPTLFMCIYIFILIIGPGKYSVDYLIARKLSLKQIAHST